MILCCYCGSENVLGNECDFCNAPLDPARPKLKEFVYLELAQRSFKDLVLFHTYDLLLLLRLVREERSKAYNLMRSLQKGENLIEMDSSTLGFSESEYRAYTARMKLIEGILIDRMGYKPKRIDDKLLESLKVKIENG